jgi:hypothetical protein
MSSKPIKFRNRGESQHWSRVQAGALNRFNWPAKRKTNVSMAVSLSSDIADLALADYRRRSGREQ